MKGKGFVLGALGALLLFAAPASGAAKNVRLLDNLPEAKDATAINFLEYGKGPRSRDVMLVTGRFGLKSYSLSDPAHPALLDAERRHQHRRRLHHRREESVGPGDPELRAAADRPHHHLHQRLQVAVDRRPSRDDHAAGPAAQLDVRPPDHRHRPA
jgi:hypothetical protein